MRLLIEAFTLKNISDIQRQLLDSGSQPEKIKAASDIIDDNKSGNIDVSKFKDVVVQAIIRFGVADNNPFLKFLNSSGAINFASKLTTETAQSVLDIMIDADQYLEELFYNNDVGIFKDGKANTEYKLKVLKVFTDRNQLNTYKNNDGKGLTLKDIMDGDVLKETKDIRTILDTYFTDAKEKKKEDQIPLNDILKKAGKNYKKDPTEVLIFLKSCLNNSKAVSELETEETIKIKVDILKNKLDSKFTDDETGAKVDKFITSTNVDYPGEVKQIIKALWSSLDDTKGGTLISGNQLIANYLGKALKDLSFKDLINYVIKLAESSTVEYIKSNLKNIRYNFPRGKYDKEFREVFNSRYKITDISDPNKSIKYLNEKIARVLQDIYAADTDTPVVKEK